MSADSQRIFLDNNATSAIDPVVIESIAESWNGGAANASSQHASGRTAARRLESSRQRLADAMRLRCHDIHADQILLTSGGTESNNLAILGLNRLVAPWVRS